MSLRSPYRRRCSRGFTLLELILTTAILASLAIAGMNRFVDAVPATLVISEFERARSEIYRARHLAMLVNKSHRVVFSPASEAYTVYRDEPGGPAVVSSVQLPAGVDLTWTTLPADTATFAPGGLLIAGGDLRLAAQTSARQASLITDSGLFLTR